jgi:chitinase
VNYATANGTALAGSDYGPASGTLTFASGEVTKTVSISTEFTVGTEVTETMYLNLSAASIGATISDAQGIGKIKNDN